jgi:hypothetical protein
MDFHAGVAEISGFAAMHEHLSTAPESPFVRMATVQRRDEAGTDVLRGLVLSRQGSDSTETVLQSEGDWYGVLDAKFGLPLQDVGAAEREQLWTRVLAAHREYERTSSA